MTCRAATSATTCVDSSPTDAQLGYDNEGRLASWQNAPTSPTSTATSLYDGEGNRVAEVTTSGGGATTTTAILGGLEAVITSSSGTTTTTAYYGGGIAESVNGVLSYLLSDPTLGSASASVNLSGLVTATQLYAPYGGVRYSSGILPTDYGFTHQRSDATTGLDDYGARWYDPVAGQFASADTTLAGGLNRYAYVAGNPETLVDLSGESPVPAKPNWKWRLAKLILDLWAGVAAGEGILGPVVHVDTGPSGGRAPNGGDEVIEIEQPVSVQPIGAGGSSNPPGLSALPDGNGPAYILVGPNGQPLPTGNPIPSAPSSRQSVARGRPISDPFNPSPNNQNRPGLDGVPGDKFSVTPTINWSAVLSHHINVVTQRLAEYHGVHGPAWHDNPTADVPVWAHTGTHGLDPAFTPWSMVAIAGAAAVAIATTGIGGPGTRGTQSAYPGEWNLAR